MEITNRKLFPHNSATAFTLVELLVVVAVIGVLMTMLSGAIIKSVKNAKHQRMIAERASLESAIVNYWHDYGHWPCNTSDKESGGKFSPTFSAKNFKVFKYMLYANTSDNPMKKSYLEEKSLMVGDPDGENRVSMSEESGSGMLTRPIVGYRKSTDSFSPYSVSFDLKLNTVDVN